MTKLLTKKFWRYPLPYLLEAFLFSPFFIALIFSAIVILFIPKLSPYLLEQTDQWQVDKIGGLSFYSDLDGDGVSEYLIEFVNRAGRKAIKVVDQKGMLIDQYNFFGEELPNLLRPSVFAADYDQDGFQELYAFSYLNDSVFVEFVSPLDPKGVQRERLFLDTIAPYSTEVDFFAELDVAYDMNKDGYKELFFSIHAGFSLQPRRLYMYDRHQNSMKKSPVSGVSLIINEFFDVNGDGQDEIFCSTISYGNIKPDQTIPYRDSSSYLMILDHNLQFLFEPIEFPVYKSKVFAYPYKYQDKDVILSLFVNYSQSDIPNSISIYNSQGHKVFEKQLDSTFRSKALDLLKGVDQNRDKLLLFKGGKKVYEMDQDINPQLIAEFPNTIYSSSAYDLDQDGKPEYFYYNRSLSLVTVTKADFSHVISLSVPMIETTRCFSGIKLNGNMPVEIFAQAGPVCMLFRYTKNLLFAFRYFTYIGIFVLMWLLMHLLKRVYKYQIDRQLKVQKELTKLQYQTVSHQVDPHFILNAMNSISAAIMAEDAEVAYQMSAKFSKLFRETLTTTDKVTRSLEDELLFVENYLQIEQKRFDNRFTFEIYTAPEVDAEMEIPKMLLQIFAENAIKHGLKHLDKDGLLRITIEKIDHKVRIILTDNGIGREKAKSLSTPGTGKGIDITRDMVHLYQKLKGVAIQLTMNDLYDEKGMSKGTKVEIVIPVKV